MELLVLNSDSSGNCYLLSNGAETLIIEAGLKYNEILKGLNFRIDNVAGCVVTHRHGDHSKSAKDIANTGIPTLALHDVIDSKGLTGSNVHELEFMKGYKIGGFNVAAFPAEHDVPCAGFVIDHQEMGRLLFVTDSNSCNYNFPGLNHILIEANFATDILLEAIQSGRTPSYQLIRVPKSHMSLETCKTVLKRNDLSKVKNIVLIHLSDSNSDENRFIREVERQTGKVVYAAKKGLKISLNKY